MTGAVAMEPGDPPFRVRLTSPREPFSEYGDLLNVEDLCEITGQSENTIRALCRRGQLPAVQIGRRWYVPKNRFIDMIEGA